MIDPNDMSNTEQNLEIACDASAARDASGGTLANDLRRLRRLAADLDAPPQLEAALRSAFRAQAGQRVDAPAASQIAMTRSALSFDKEPKAPAARVAPRGHTSAARTSAASHRAAGIAAVICAIMIVTAASLTDVARRDPLTAKQAQAPATNAPVTDDTARATTLAAIYREAQAEAASGNVLDVPVADAEGVKPTKAETAPPATNTFAPRFAYASRTSRARITSTPLAPAAREAYDAAPAELATEFLPLLEPGSLAAIESGHVVRVRLPRSSLTALGLPMNQDRAGESVTADVLLGEDGVARAIRFVR